MEKIDDVRQKLMEMAKTAEEPRAVLRSDLLRELYKVLPSLASEKRAEFGQRINALKTELMDFVEKLEAEKENVAVEALDVTAPCDINELMPATLQAEDGSRHPLAVELERVVEIYNLMGFEAVESRQLDDEFHMFDSLNFPKGHPARDGYDTFRTEECFIPPAHTSTMQHRILLENKDKLEQGGQIAAVSYGRVFRNEDVDDTHEHTFYQCEGVFVSKDATLGQMLAVLRKFFETYYGQTLKIKTQPGYFPFTEPSLEFLIEKPAALGGKGGDYLEMLGCGMIHPNVLAMARIDSEKYRGFAWGGGIDRLVMLKYGINDVRLFESGSLRFLKEF